MKRFRETGSMLKDPSKGSSLRRDLSKGAADIRAAFKKIKDAGKSLTRGTKDLSATRVSTEGPKQGPSPKPKVTAQQAGDKLINASKKLAPKQEDNRSPSGRLIIEEQVIEEKTRGGRGSGKRLFNFTPVESSGGGARTGNNKNRRDVKLFGGTYTSRGNRRR